MIYRDLKPENVIISCEGYIKLVDLGVAKKLKTGKSLRTTTIIGTPHYMAPEVITSMGYTFTVDLWAIGIITYELLCGKLPFGNDSDDPFFIYSEIMNAVVKYPRSCPKHCKSLIETLLSREPQQRLGHGYEQLRKHPFFNGNNWTRLLRKE